MKRLFTRPSVAVAALLASTSFAALPFGPAFGSEVNTGYFGVVAIEGYDTVAYFTDHRAVKGSPGITREWQGAIWQFASEEHRKLFAASPEAYAPQFGGLCTEGVAAHEITVNLEPEYWQIVDGKLYLTASNGFADLKGNMSAAVANWPEVHGKLAR